MNYLLQLEQQESVTIEEALSFSQQVTKQYLSMLHNLMLIRKKTPVTEDEPTFRSASRTETSTPQLYHLLNRTHEGLLALEDQLLDKKQNTTHDKEIYFEELIGAKLFTELAGTIEQCEIIYENHSHKFVMILKDLIRLKELLQEKLPTTMNLAEHVANEENMILDASNAISELIIGPDEKMVFVRVFNRKMSSLSTSKEGLQWVKPLLDSVKQAEKHGFAIYEHEQDVIRSLKGEAYGYVTVKIKKTQDISQQRPKKVDSALGCSLLTITPIELDNMVKLTYHNLGFWIREGQLYPVQ